MDSYTYTQREREREKHLKIRIPFCFLSWCTVPLGQTVALNELRHLSSKGQISILLLFFFSFRESSGEHFLFCARATNDAMRFDIYSLERSDVRERAWIPLALSSNNESYGEKQHTIFCVNSFVSLINIWVYFFFRSLQVCGRVQDNSIRLVADFFSPRICVCVCGFIPTCIYACLVNKLHCRFFIYRANSRKKHKLRCFCTQTHTESNRMGRKKYTNVNCVKRHTTEIMFKSQLWIRL